MPNFIFGGSADKHKPLVKPKLPYGFYILLAYVVCPALLGDTRYDKFIDKSSNITLNEMKGSNY